MKIHIVQKGDTLWNLSKKYGVSFEELKSINSQLSNPDMIMPGMKIKIPGTVKAMTTKVKEAPVKMPGTTVKEMPIMSGMPLKKEMPIKEMPIKEMPYQPTPMPAQPAIPEVDIHNYYLVNMANMNVQSPAKVPEKPQPVIQPIMMPTKPPQPIMTPQPIQEHAKPMVLPLEQCVPITPIMPGTGFCEPAFPMYATAEMMHSHMPMCQPLVEESSSLVESTSSAQQHYHQVYQQTPYVQGYYQPQYGVPYAQAYMPQMPVHGMQHINIESSSSSSSSSTSSTSSYMEQQMHQMYGQQMMPYQQPSTQANPHMTTQPIMPQDDDCGCGDSETGETSAKQWAYVPTQQMMQAYPQQQQVYQQHQAYAGQAYQGHIQPYQQTYAQQATVSQPYAQQVYQQPVYTNPQPFQAAGPYGQPLQSRQQVTLPQMNQANQAAQGARVDLTNQQGQKQPVAKQQPNLNAGAGGSSLRGSVAEIKDDNLQSKGTFDIPDSRDRADE
ncbi:MAG: SafA/ExsA family spore coat assembly protein [Bacillus sp. (in: firmicutes)]